MGRQYQAADVYNATLDIKLYEWVSSLERVRDAVRSFLPEAMCCCPEGAEAKRKHKKVKGVCRLDVLANAVEETL